MAFRKAVWGMRLRLLGEAQPRVLMERIALGKAQPYRTEGGKAARRPANELIYNSRQDNERD